MADRLKVIALKCACGNERETDVDFARTSVEPCGYCGKVEWKQLQGRSVAKDRTAPLELIAKQEKERGEQSDE